MSRALEVEVVKLSSGLAVLQLALAALIWPLPGIAQVPLRPTAIVIKELQARDRAAADTFALAIAASHANRHAEAAALFARVAQRVPGHPDALHRQALESWWANQSGIRADLRQLELAKESPEAIRAKIAALIPSIESASLPPRVRMDAIRSFRALRLQALEDPGLALLACRLALRANDQQWLSEEVFHAERLAPENPWSHYYRATLQEIDGDRYGAAQSLERARAQGLPRDVYLSIADSPVKSQSRFSRYARPAVRVLGVWLACFLLLLILGALLSRSTLAATRRVSREAAGRPSGLDAQLRRIYRWVLWACCVFYFLSLPLIFLLVLGLGGGLIYAMLAAGHVSVRLLLVAAFVTIVTLWALLRSLFVRGRDEDPGLKVGPREQPRLREVLDEVAARVGTRAVTNVYLATGTEIAVMERGGLSKQLSGQSERCLILGIGGLEGMTLRPFKAVLAHEYGHFSNRDTAGGGFALAVRRSLITTAISLAQGGADSWYNPAWLFVNGFYRVFLRISQGASRLQEVLADRWAAVCYGAAAFKSGLSHIIDRSIRFDVHLNAVLNEVIAKKRPLTNLYSYQPETQVEEIKFAQAMGAAIIQPPSPYDSHPRPTDRFAWVESLGATGAPPAADDEDEVWTLFVGREALEQRLTEFVRDSIKAGHGIEIQAE